MRRIQYGPHTFGNPLEYIRVGKKGIHPALAHERIKGTFEKAFNNPNSIPDQIAKKFSIKKDSEVKLDFINYGNDSLVYLCTLPSEHDITRLTILINQPTASHGQLKSEYENLLRLSHLDPRYVIRPYAYFTDGEYELYAAPYIDKAQCIFSGHGYPWGIFNPDPYYHFESFHGDIKGKVISTMIALLVNYYDQEAGQGLTKTHLSGDDFILSQDFRDDSRAPVLSSMKLIAARDWITASLQDYLEILKAEFVIGTHYTDSEVINGKIIVNYKCSVPLKIDEIEHGIELGLKIRAKRDSIYYFKRFFGIVPAQGRTD